MIELGIDRILNEPDLKKKLQGHRLGYVANAASVTRRLELGFDALMEDGSFDVRAIFGPQQGFFADKQDNMVETGDVVEPRYQIPVYSLYGKVRRPTQAMFQDVDVILFDLQSLGCRIYTFVTTLLYVMEAAARYQKAVWVLDRPNPVGRPIEGLRLRAGQESFVGAATMPMRYGVTDGELALWFKKELKINVDLEVITMKNYHPDREPGWGWPLSELSWVNPTPNASNLWMARNFPGSVLIEGTTLSEGRGTTRPLELVGAPDIDARKILGAMKELGKEWMLGCHARLCSFEPTFQKHTGKLCHGIQFHVDTPDYLHHEFKPYRLYALFLKAVRALYPKYPIWRDFVYEYVSDRPAIDVINGGAELREWIDDPAATVASFEAQLKADESSWRREISSYKVY